ncbi:unnamed protein product [Cuscuta campestris]|uniref:Peptidase A1 domain-containing protein n=1 Tax=Cuscuta campestris TaxID=132261 RepID=A0A484LW07_9ASTE|nr:unnamed protein product [Cuscuta campestris]
MNHPCAGSHGQTALEILTRDKLRVSSIHARVNKVPSEAGTDLPAQSGSHIGSGNYIVSVGIGNPATTLSLAFATGSDLTWTQCLPCVGKCYPQNNSIFDPSKSTTYSPIPCSSDVCSYLLSYTSYSKQNCTLSPSCEYYIRYGDSSSVGNLATERLSLTPSDTVQNFTFGCGHYQGGLFRGASGFLGLGPGPFSIVSQTAQKHGRKFSYCLPTVNGTRGYLKFGGGAAAPPEKNIRFTPLSTGTANNSYQIQMLSISVGGKNLQIKPEVFEKAGMIIDSGTVITRLPPEAYVALRSAFVEEMKYYRNAPGDSLLDTCFDFSNTTEDKIKLPRIGFGFSGNVSVDVPPSGILYVIERNLSKVCLAFAGSEDPAGMGIYGNTQQQTLDVVYDVAGGRLGFSPGGCS